MRRSTHAGVGLIAIAALVGVGATSTAHAAVFPFDEAVVQSVAGEPAPTESPSPSPSPGPSESAEPDGPDAPSGDDSDPSAPRQAPDEQADGVEPAPIAPAPGPIQREAAAFAVQTVISPFAAGAHRLAGADRFETAVAISKRYAPSVPVLYLATGLNYPDALTAASAAAKIGGPLLLTQPDAIPDVVRAEIARLAPARIVVAGGEAVVGDEVFRELIAMAPEVVRIGGEDRFRTGELIIADAFGSATEAFIATGFDFADALAASAAAGSRAAPVFLVNGYAGSVPSTILTALGSLGVRTVRIAGGPAAVSTGIQAQIASRGFTVVRYAGQDRFLTAAAINEAMFAGVTPTTAFLATGAGFADALAGAALAGRLGGPLYLTHHGCIPYVSAVALTAMAPPARVILGGTEVVGNGPQAGVACQQEWAKPANGRITDVFGPRAPICTPGGCTGSFHRGTDLGTGCAAPIHAAASGRVTVAGPVGTFGNFIRITHDPTRDTGYAHLMNGGILVGVGQYVLAGQQIGWSGATGAATGCHLHFEVYENGAQVDPVPFMALRGVRLG